MSTTIRNRKQKLVKLDNKNKPDDDSDINSSDFETLSDIENASSEEDESEEEEDDSEDEEEEEEEVKQPPPRKRLVLNSSSIEKQNRKSKEKDGKSDDKNKSANNQPVKKQRGHHKEELILLIGPSFNRKIKEDKDEKKGKDDKKVENKKGKDDKKLENKKGKDDKKLENKKGKDDKKVENKNKKTIKEESEDEESEDIEETEDEEEYSEDEDDEYYDTEDSYEYYMDELEEYKSDTEKQFLKNIYDKTLETAQNKFYKKSSHPPKPPLVNLQKESEAMIKEYKQLQSTKHLLLAQLKKCPSNKICKKALENCNEDIQSLIVQQKKANFKQFHDLLYKERKEIDQNKYFIESLSHDEQLQAIERLENKQQHSLVKIPYRFAVLNSGLSETLKTLILQKINQLENMEGQADQEYHKLKHWVDTFMKIPFGKYKNDLVNLEKDGLEACHEFMNRAQTILDKCTYGLQETKMQIIQMLGNWITNPSAIGTAIAIKGPPGTGKTSLVQEGVSKILGREFVFIPLGGCGDGSFLEGHSYTYEGSTWGKIVQSLLDCQSMNPVFYFDELDKVSESQRGQEIINILIHLTDTTQNTQFTDKYFSEVNEIDLSKCLFIFSYNDESKVSPILLNRMHIIQTKGYNVEEKLIIGKKYLLPSINEQIHIQPEEIILTDEILKMILNNEQMCKKEDGVRNFKRALQIIFSKLNLYRIMKPDALLFQNYPQMPKTITFPHTVTKQDLEVFLKNKDESNSSLMSMYV